MKTEIDYMPNELQLILKSKEFWDAFIERFGKNNFTDAYKRNYMSIAEAMAMIESRTLPDNSTSEEFDNSTVEHTHTHTITHTITYSYTYTQTSTNTNTRGHIADLDQKDEPVRIFARAFRDWMTTYEYK